MRKILGAILFLIILPFSAIAADSNEVLTLKRDLAQERILRIQSELVLMKQQYKEGQAALINVGKELESLNAQIKTLSEPPAAK